MPTKTRRSVSCNRKSPWIWWTCRVNLCRRFGVREFRPDGWRTRSIDDYTDSEHNPATQAVDCSQNESLATLDYMIRRLVQAGHQIKFWKRDVEKAFRSVPIRSEHLEYAWIAWMDDCGSAWAAQHLGMPFFLFVWVGLGITGLQTPIK